MGDQPGVAPAMSSRHEESPIDREIEQARQRNPPRFRTVRQELHRAAMEGDWEAAKKIINDNADLDPKSIPLIDFGMTALLVAADSGRTEFVEEMVRILNDDEELKQKDQYRRNVLHHVAIGSDVAAAKAVLDKWPRLVHEKDSAGFTPLFSAAQSRHPSKAKEMLEYLYNKTNDNVYFDLATAPDLIVAVTASGCYNVALEILKKNPELAVATNSFGWSTLYVLASQPSAFASEKIVSLWKKTPLSWISFKSERQSDATELVHIVCKQLQKKEDSFVLDYLMPNSIPAALHLATKNGVFKLVVLCLKYFPYMILSMRNGHLPVHVAVEHRQVELFNHMMKLTGYNIGGYVTTQVDGQGNILHLAAHLAHTPQLHSIAGPAFQLQRELEWFKAVEALVFKEHIDELNSEGQKPVDLFYSEHDDLIKDAKKWITVTSNSCMVVAALVATVAFASMVTVPGGNDSGTGKPVLSNKEVFIVFSISNALSMISSAIALLMFLSLQTSRFTTEDFLTTLPKNLLRGLLALFFAVATMMIAFGTAIGMALQTRLKWAYIPIIVVACIPTIIFTKLQLPLLFQTLGVTFGPSLFPKQRNLGKYSLLLEEIV